MKRLTLSLAAILATATAATAMEPSDLDIDGDGFATVSEVRTIFPNFRSPDFRSLDTNDDNRLSNNELDDGDAQPIINKYVDSAAIIHSLSTIDQNGDRFLTLAELQGTYGGLQDAEFRQIDVNRDDRVSAPELYAPLAQALVTRYEMGGEDVVTIMQVDIDDDAFASFAELKATFPGLTSADFELIDMNGDNRISSREYYDPASQATLDRN